MSNIRERWHCNLRGPNGNDFQARPLRTGWRLIFLFGSLISVASAQVFGDFTYAVNQTTTPVSVTITDYPTTATGPVVIPESIEGMPVTAIGPEAFAFCASITSVMIPAGVASIGTQAFLNCSSLASVGGLSGVTSIESAAFFSCVALTSVTLPAGITGLSDTVFGSCTGLTSVMFLGDITFIGSNAFNGCSRLASFTIPSTVTFIGANAFRFCTGLTSIEIPGGVSAIPFGLFSDCTNLVSVTVPTSLTSIGGSAFAKCSKLTSLSTPGAATSPPSIVIPSTVTSLGTFVFSECSALTSVMIPNGVPEIGTSAFELCTALTTISIPPSVKNIGENAFSSCSSLLSIEITSDTMISFGGIGAPIDVVPNVFSRCVSLTSIAVNPSNTSFSSSGGVLFTKTGLTLVAYPGGKVGPYAIPPSVTTIRSGAFRFAAGVTSIQIPPAVATIGIEAFSGCSALSVFSVDGSNTKFKSEGGILYTKSGLSLFTYPAGLSGPFAIPAGVTTISVSAFRYCGSLTAVTFPGSIVTINDSAFANCGLLASATFEGNAPTTVGINWFQSAATGFTVYFNSAATGATFPTWNTYRSRVIGTNAALFNWLLDYSLPINSDLKSDSNGDGVSLLMAYALNLDPGQNLSGSLPQPVFPAEQMSMSFYAGATGVTYVVEVSPDLVNWGTEGVSYADLNQIRTATASRTPGSRFMRLSASY